MLKILHSRQDLSGSSNLQSVFLKVQSARCLKLHSANAQRDVESSSCLLWKALTSRNWSTRLGHGFENFWMMMLQK
jgi:hypothetical protein